MRRFSIIAAGAAILSLPLSAQNSNALRNEVPVVCRGEATGNLGEALTVSINVSAAGGRTLSYASWQPPILAAQGLANPKLPEQPGLSLSMIYDGSSSNSIGSLQHATVIVSFFSPLRKQESRRTLETRAASLSAGIRFDSASVAPLKLLRPSDGMADLPGITARTAAIVFPESLPRETTIFIYNQKGKVVSSVRFATGSNSTRDRLFMLAWPQADSAAANPAACDPA